MFEINPNLEIKKEELLGTTIFVAEDFYEKPDEVFNLLFNREIPFWKIDEKPTTNGVYYEDRRTTEYNYSLKKVYEFLKGLCGQTYYQPEIVTNVTKFYKDEYNDWKNCIWWPHRDSGYNGIVFFSDECGTNLYSPDYEKDAVKLAHEHKHPWVKKGEYTVIKTLEPKFNKLVFFDGLKFPHGMDVSSDRYFGDEYRYNQVFFFDHPNIRDVTTDVLNQYRDELTAEFCGDLETAAQRVDLGEFVDIEETFYGANGVDLSNFMSQGDIDETFYKELPPYAFGNEE